MSKFHAKAYMWVEGELKVLLERFESLEEALESEFYSIYNKIKIFDVHGALVHTKNQESKEGDYA